MTNAEEFEAAMRCETEQEANEFRKKAILRRVDAGLSVQRAREGFLQDIGYMAGYYGPEIRDKAEQLFGAIHPVFGELRPTTEECLALGSVAAALGMTQARRVAEMLQARYRMTPPDAARVTFAPAPEPTE